MEKKKHSRKKSSRSQKRISNKFVRFVVENKVYMLGAALLLTILIVLIVMVIVEGSGKEEILSQIGGFYGV